MMMIFFVQAADIGKFLSEIVIRSYGKLLQLIAFTSVQLESLKHLLRRRGDEGDDEDSVDSGLVFF